MILKNDFPAPVLDALNKLKEHNIDGYVVGGAVRDIIMGKTPSDYDITTSSSPEQNLKIFSDYKTFETGIRYGTITVIIENLPIEITTFRTDGEYKNNRKPEDVKFSENIEEDLSRRDFTINALAYSPSKGLVDLYDGRCDIEKKVIRAIGNPNERFKEDALRILRALRFSSRLGFEIEEKTKKAIFENKNLLKNIAKERLREEFNGILMGKHAIKVLSDFRDIIAVFIPEISPCFDFDQKSKYHINDVYTHILKALENAPDDLTVRLSVYFHDIAKPHAYTTDKYGFRHYKEHPDMGAEIARSILKNLKYDNKTIKDVTTLIKYHDTIISPDKKDVKRFLHLIGKELLDKLFAVKFSDCKGKPNNGGQRYEDAKNAESIMKEILMSGECFSLKMLNLNGDDLIQKKIPPHFIGEILNSCLNEVIQENIPNEKSALLKYALDYYKNINHS